MKEINKLKKVMGILIICTLFLTGCMSEAKLQEKIIGKWQVEETVEIAKDKTKENDLAMLSYIILFSEGSNVEFIDSSKVTFPLGETTYALKKNEMSIKVGQTEMTLTCKLDKEGNLLLEDKIAKVKLNKK